jgi:hypothetical protein
MWFLRPKLSGTDRLKLFGLVLTALETQCTADRLHGQITAFRRDLDREALYKEDAIARPAANRARLDLYRFIRNLP